MLERVSFGSNAFTDGTWTLEEAMRAIAAEGYPAVNVLADAPLLWPLPLSPTRLRSIKGTLKETGLVVSSINGATAIGYYGGRDRPPAQDFGPCFADKEPGLRTLKVGFTKLVIDLAEQLEVRDISILSGYCPEGVEHEKAWEWMVDGMLQALMYAERKGVNLNIEFEPDILARTSADVRRLLRELPSSNLGVNFDIGHSLVVGEDIPLEIRSFGSKINGADIEDIALDSEGKPVHFHLPLGQGVMPFVDIFRAFQEVGFEQEHFYHVEMYSQFQKPVEAARISMAYLRKLEEELQRVG